MHLADESDVALDVLPDAQEGRGRGDQHEDAQPLHRCAPGSLPRQEDRHGPSAVEQIRQAREALLIAHTPTTYGFAKATSSGAIVVSSAARSDSIVSNGPSALRVCATSALTPGSCCRVSTSIWFGATGTNRYCSKAATSSGETYLPISPRNWAMVV